MVFSSEGHVPDNEKAVVHNHHFLAFMVCTQLKQAQETWKVGLTENQFQIYVASEWRESGFGLGKHRNIARRGLRQIRFHLQKL